MGSPWSIPWHSARGQELLDAEGMAKDDAELTNPYVQAR
jgi:hypothetical protein